MLYLFDNCALDTSQRELRRGGDAIPLQPQVFDLLKYPVRHRDRVVTKDDLIGAIWGGRIVSELALTTRLNAARTGIGDSRLRATPDQDDAAQGCSLCRRGA